MYFIKNTKNYINNMKIVSGLELGIPL